MSDLKIRAINRKQYFMETTNLEDMVGEDDPVRATWAFVERLDLASFYNKIKTRENEAGSPAHNPKVLLSMWIYAYSQGISSAREVERLSKEVTAWRWLCGDEPINYHTLSDFRVRYKEELDELFTNSLGVLSAEGLITLERITQDGTKIRANAGIDTFRREEKLKAHLKLAREQVELLSDPESEAMTKRIGKAKERAVVERHLRLEEAMQEYEKLSQNNNKKKKEKVRVSTTDPQSRVMKQSDGGYRPSYNAQIAVDTNNKIIVGKHTTTNCEDTKELEPMIEGIKEKLERYPAQVIADGGYNTYPNIIMTAEKEIDLIAGERGNNNASGQQYRKRGVTKEFESGAFRYEKDSKSMICPEDKTLKFDGREELPGRTNFKYRAHIGDCSNCSSKPKCCPGATKKGRSVIRKEYHEDVIKFKEKMQKEESKLIYKKRGENAEFVNAFIKDKVKLRQFRLRGIRKVDTELTFAVLAYNIMRWFRLRWYPALA